METTKKTQVVGINNAGIVIICCLVIAGKQSKIGS